MAYSPDILYHGNPPVSVTNVYQVPALNKVIIKEINLVNIDDYVTYIDLYLVPSGQSATKAHVLLKNYELGQDTAIILNMSRVMTAGYSIQLKQTVTNGCNITISGVVIS